MNKIRLLLIEDNRLLRDGLTAMINDEPDFKVVAAFGNGEDVALKVREAKPEVVLLDVGLRSQNSLRVVKLVQQESPVVKIIVMDLLPVQADLVDFVKAGASGFILKDATFGDFKRTIRSVVEGKDVLPPTLTGSLFSQIVERTLTSGKERVIDSVRMTKREREVIELIAEGLSNKEIAQRLNIATYTVKSHVHNILEKLALHTRLQVVTYTQTEVRFKETKSANAAPAKH